jgi:protein-S-isoprenylcysteine O-methyltransferase Ste14
MEPFLFTNRAAFLLFSISFAGWFFFELWLQRFVQPRHTSIPLRDHQPLATLLVGGGTFAAFFAMSLFPALQFFSNGTVFIGGFLCFWAGLGLCLWTVQTQRHFRPKNKGKIKRYYPGTGPYHYVKYPFSSGTVLLMLGSGLMLENYLSLLLCLGLALVSEVFFICRQETGRREKSPKRGHDQEKPKRLIPFVW